MLRYLFILGLPALAAAQGLHPRMSVPALGFVFDDNAKSIRLVSGVPGAAGLDASVGIDASLDSAFLYSRLRIAVGGLKGGGIAVIDWNGTPRISALNTSLTALRFAAFSRLGAWVAISDGSRVELWSDLQNNPVRKASYDVETLTALAVGDDGALFAGSRNGTLLQLGSEVRTVLSGVIPTGLAIAQNGADLLMADAASQSLQLVRDARSGSSATIIANLKQDIGAAGFSADGTLAAVSLAEDVALVNVAEGTVQAAGCRCRMEKFDSLAGNLVFPATDARTGWLVVVNADTVRPSSAWIPEIGGGVQ